MSKARASTPASGQGTSSVPDIKQAILALMAKNGMKSGDPINIVQAEHELLGDRYTKTEFCRGIVELLDQGVLTMIGYSFYLTTKGAAAVSRIQVHFPCQPLQSAYNTGS